jgi:hypothetical protein
MNIESRSRVLEWDSMLDGLDYEQILGVSSDESIETCRQAYYRFAQAFHPDSYPDADALLRSALTRIFQRGAEAYRVLSNPVLRTRWSIAKQQGALRLTESPRAPELDLNAELEALHLHCRSAGAKLCTQQAYRLFSKANFLGCLGQLRSALDYEGGANPFIARCQEALALRISSVTAESDRCS